MGNGENGYSEVIFPTQFNANICSASVSTTEPDADGVSDLADLCPDTAANSVVDWDGCAVIQLPDWDKDGHNNSFDNCPWTPNFDQIDSDGNGRGDACNHLPSGC